MINNNENKSKIDEFTELKDKRDYFENAYEDVIMCTLKYDQGNINWNKFVAESIYNSDLMLKIKNSVLKEYDERLSNMAKHIRKDMDCIDKYAKGEK